jgi:hypothetical protein
MNIGSGVYSLTASSFNGGSFTGIGGTPANPNVFSSTSNVTGIFMDLQNLRVWLQGSATSWTMTGPAIPLNPDFSPTAAATNITYNGSTLQGSGLGAVQQSGAIIGSTLAEIARAALLESQDTDSVAKQILYGFAGDVGTTPPMNHQIDDTGISVPGCFNESREGQTCK